LQDYIAEKESVTYSCMSYTTIEISATLAAQQQQHIVQQRGHARAWRCVHGDAAQPQAWGDVARALPQQHSMQQHAFVLMMEVLDNLPHDRWGIMLCTVYCKGFLPCFVKLDCLTFLGAVLYSRGVQHASSSSSSSTWCM
jgi:hypothetical protein